MTLNACFLRPLESGMIRAEARVINCSRSTAYVEGSLYVTDGKMLARGTGGFFLLQGKAGSA